jgi:OmpA-OmpF porin, OOP family
MIMKRAASILLTIVCLSLPTVGVALSKQPDAEGAKDPPLFNRMPGYYIQRYEEKDFDTRNFLVQEKEVSVEGHLYSIRYSKQPEAKEASRIQILRNYENAVTKIGGTVLKSDSDGSSYMKLVKDGKEIWVHVDAYITSEYSVHIVEKGSMAQTIVANAEVFSNDIKATGHTAVYGIYFDTGKSVVKPESETALGEIGKLLKADAGLKVNVVGHTDSVGGIDSNMKLSQDRANAVVQVLVAKYGVAATRVRAYGVGPLAPVASNDREEGRAKNRRVELVKQ